MIFTYTLLLVLSTPSGISQSTTQFANKDICDQNAKIIVDAYSSESKELATSQVKRVKTFCLPTGY